MAVFSFINPPADTYVAGAASGPGHAAQRRDKNTLRDYLPDHDCHGYRFIPVSFETLGHYDPGAIHLCAQWHMRRSLGLPGVMRAATVLTTFTNTLLLSIEGSPLAYSLRLRASRPLPPAGVGSEGLIGPILTCISVARGGRAGTSCLSSHCCLLVPCAHVCV